MAPYRAMPSKQPPTQAPRHLATGLSGTDGTREHERYVARPTHYTGPCAVYHVYGVSPHPCIDCACNPHPCLPYPGPAPARWNGAFALQISPHAESVTSVAQILAFGARHHVPHPDSLTPHITFTKTRAADPPQYLPSSSRPSAIPETNIPTAGSKHSVS
jgi:hypothetical protein